jgi:amicoumacin kinase
MIKAIQAQFTDAIAHEAAFRYGITQDKLNKLGGFESYVYAYSHAGQERILKITHTLRRSENYIRGELEWLNFLADRGLPVAQAVPSAKGHLIERIPAEGGHYWLLIAYEKAPGHRPTADDWNGDLFTAWGRLVGQMHRHTKSYRLSNPAYKRQEWYEEEQLDVRKYLPAHEAAVIARADELMAHIRTLPTPPDAFGLLHTDLHHGNFFVDQGRITAFDFDDIHYQWFVSDIAVILFGATYFPAKPYEDENEHAQEFLTHFFRGYHAENRLDPRWLGEIPTFLMLRDLLNFVIVYQAMDPTTFHEKQQAEFDAHRARIVGRRPLVDLDWLQFAQV